MLGKANIKTKLMNQLKVYWTMKDGQKISVDDMDEQHVRNSLKMVLRKLAKAKAELKTKSVKSKRVTLNGEMAQLWNDTNEENDMHNDCDASQIDIY